MSKIRTFAGKIKRKVYHTARKVLRKDENANNPRALNMVNNETVSAKTENKALEIKKKPPVSPISYTDKVKDDSIVTVACLKDKFCCGCGACANICPKNAITMESNDEGFLQPAIDMSLCVECGLCKKMCPSLNTVYKNSSEPECHAAYTFDSTRDKSSSGGIFTILAEKILSKNGYVCGATLDDNLTVRHTIIANKKDLDVLRKSKYVQSDTGFVFREIKKLLDDDNYVLFCGCGCQVAGLYATLGNKEYDKLYTIDLMCHGSPSPGLFKKYIETHYNKDNIDFIGFREKDHFGWSTEMTVKFKDGQIHRDTRVRDPFYQAFLPCLSVREYCGVCAFSKLPRQGDITLADFWGAERYKREYSDGKGTSIVSVNNAKGKTLYDSVASELVMNEPLSLDLVLSTGQPFDHCFKNHPARKQYFEQIKLGASLEKAYEYATKRKFDVAILGMWYGANYGSVATYYALHEIVRSFGLSVIMIDKWKIDNDPEANPNLHSRIFASKHYEVSRHYPLRELRTLNNHVDTFILGSDQVWNRGVNKYSGFANYFDFVDESKKKLSYAASFGHDKDFCNARDRETVRQYLERFDGISVREASGVKICKDTFNVDAIQVLDPVFAADRKIFDDLIDETELSKSYSQDKRFFTAYILDPTPEKKEAIQYIAEKTGLEPKIILDGRPTNVSNEENKSIMDMDDNIVSVSGVEEWLFYFKYSDYVITDSCHGMSFAIVYNKPFVAIGNRARGVARFESLVDLMMVHDRYVTDAADIVGNEKFIKPIDYSKINAILTKQREISLAWLKEKLFAPKVFSSNCAYPIIDKRLN